MHGATAVTRPLESRAAVAIAPAPTLLSPPVSIDLLVINTRDEVLLGKKHNRPLQNFWFVPGGQLRKDECVSDAFTRIAREEIGQDMAMAEARFLGVYEHLYAEDHTNREGFGAHFLALVYRIGHAQPLTQRLPRVQHRDYRWTSPAALLTAPDVHRYVKKYFRRDAAIAR
jgi:colanic acid biosynthesis protein WcaH